MISKKTIIISLCIIVLLVGAYLFLSFGGNSRSEITETEKAPETTAAPIFHTSVESIESLKITIGQVSYEFYKADNKWKVRGFENIIFNQASVSSTVLDYVQLTPMLIVDENPEDASVYGFENPIASSEIKTSDGKSAVFYLGNQTKGGNGYYFMKDGDPAVYTVSTVLGNNMQKALIDYRDKTLLELNAEDIREITMTVQGVGEVNLKKLDEPMDATTTWVMTKPFDIGVYDEKISEHILEPITAVQIAQFVSDDPSDSQLSESGFDNPTYYYEIKTEDKSYKVHIGKNYDGYYIVKRDDMPSVYLVSADYFSFLFTDIFSYVHSYVYLPDRSTISEISADTSEGSFDITLTSEGDDEKFFVNGNRVKKADFTDFYKEFFGIPIKGSVTKAAENPDDIRFSYTVKRTDGAVDTVSFVNMNSKYSYIYVNGKNEFYVYTEDVDRIVTALDDFGKLSEEPYTEEETSESETEQVSKGTNWIALLIVIIIIALIAVFPLSMLKSNKNKK